MSFQFSNKELLQAVKKNAELDGEIELNTIRSVGEYLKRTSDWLITAQKGNDQDEQIQTHLKIAHFIINWAYEQMEADKDWLEKIEVEYTKMMAGTDRGPVKPIKSVDDWYCVTQELSILSPRIIMLQKANTDGRLDEALATNKRVWIEMVRRSAKGPKPYRDQVIRNKGFAFSVAAAMGKSISEKECEEAFLENIFAEEVTFLVSLLSENELREQHLEAYNMDLSQYIEALALYYCNQLLNLADGGNRELYQKDGTVCQRLVELTAKLEERKMFDEFYVARTAVVNAFATFRPFKGQDEYTAWLTQASDLLTEFYSDRFITKF